ncbi:GIY-YIG nuclease family protein [Rufibacter sp. DG15C]|uniref:GIY-YIG nuclease family protein n=1 Tax=Rufibacter sp. DG15C TaxID=1379909 RepID=UPI000834C89F|nr:GIY-YIG nuclease family protein [Rufibacter sp. DG15C]
MQRLLDIGFEEIGDWNLNHGSLTHSIPFERHNHRDLLYAFVNVTQVMYIGKTADKLKNRMRGYKNASGTQRTNIRIRNNIVRLLESGQDVMILALVGSNESDYMGYRLSLASGLEDALIARIQPQWNYRGTNRILEQQMPPIESETLVENNLHMMEEARSVEITLGPEYFTKGRFNFRIADLDHLPDENAYVTLFLGEDADFFIQGRFHFADSNKRQARVDGNKALRAWFQDNYRENDTIRVDIIDAYTFRLH